MAQMHILFVAIGLRVKVSSGCRQFSSRGGRVVTWHTPQTGSNG